MAEKQQHHAPVPVCGLWGGDQVCEQSTTGLETIEEMGMCVVGPHLAAVIG